MANWDRALVAVSNNLGQLANNAQDRQQEKWRAMRDENLMRIQHALGEQSRATERTENRAMRKEEFEAEKGERRSMFEEEKKSRKEMFDAETAARGKENQTERDWRSKENSADRAVQLAQIGDKNGKDYDARYLGQLDKLDKRIQEINDYKTQGVAEGKFIDNNATAAYDQELAQLLEQRRAIAQERDVTLARNGDNRYRKMSKAEVDAILAANGGKMPGQSAQPPARMPEDGTPMAAQAPQGGSSIKVPPAPPKPPGMAAREERKRAPDRAAGQDSLALGSWQDATNPPPPPPRRSGMPQAGEGGRQLVQLGRDIGGALDSRKQASEQATVANRVKKVLESGGTPNADLVKQLAQIDRRQLTEAFGINEKDLAKMGL